MKRATITLLLGLMLAAFASASFAQVISAPVPNPVLVLSGTEYYETGGRQFTRHKYFIFNAESFPNTMFAASPELPPCGTNTKSSRTWIDVYDQRGKRLQGFCAIGSNRSLDELWFATERDEIAPSWIYIEFTDRKTGNKYKSNLAETVL